ncbi:hypothetical protein V1639_13955 [Pseudarthrobacter sp. J75]|uniref:hypothetical protein n=1 Tax=unclassified Pseudarthrobacter TaxID=2647000 RepID=UPI002E81F6E4|nr:MULTISPECIES: hypothetical protein [unclassified Pseudarthrobacter]MEE2524609.1 hypothetical protein [Pseudarthrobacter sp. J47]MEE2530126.1 hypothetical protein [Pseudarthrobacter sp. J75]
MGDPTTLTLNLTFLGTVGLGFVMFLVMFVMFVITLLIAGIGKLVAVIAMALVGRFPHSDTIPVVHVSAPASIMEPEGTGTEQTAAAGTASPANAPAKEPKKRKPAKDWGSLLKPAAVKTNVRSAVEHHPLLNAAKSEPAALADDWAAAVAAADARAAEREKAKKPAVRTTVRDLPDPEVPAQELSKVAPLVESALEKPASAAKPDPVPQSFKKPYIPAGLVKAGTGSLAARSGTPPLVEQISKAQRKAG